jgi:hypothetical protein
MTRVLVLPLFLLLSCAACAQVDTLSYDGMVGPADGMLYLADSYPSDEAAVIYTTRFTPRERCTLRGVLVAFSLVRFQTLPSDDSLIVTIHEDGPVPPTLKNVVATFKVGLGKEGFPRGNVDLSGENNPTRDLLYVPFAQPIVIAPKRDFHIGVAFASRQSKAIDSSGLAIWKGGNLCVATDNAEYDRYRRYSVKRVRQFDTHLPLGARNRLAMYMRAVLQYDATLPDTKLTGVGGDDAVAAERPALDVYPQPISGASVATLDLARETSARLTLHDALGRAVCVLADELLPAGRHRFALAPSGERLANGVYYLRLVTPGAAETRALLHVP